MYAFTWVGKFSCDLEGAGQRPERPHVLLNAVQDDGVAVGEIVADGVDVEAAIGEPVAVGSLFVFSARHPYRRWLVQKRRQQWSTIDGPGSSASK